MCCKKHYHYRGWHRPPSASASAVDKLADLLAIYINSELIVLRDLNLNWLNSASDHLKEVCANIHLSQVITDPTRPNLKDPTKSSLIDMILTNRREKISDSGVFELGFSDYCPIACIRTTKLKKLAPCLVSRRNLKHFNEQAFLRDLIKSDTHDTVKIPSVDLALDYFCKSFNSIVDKHAPLKKYRIQNRSSPWFSAEIPSLLKRRNKAWTLARRTGDPGHWLAFRQLRNKCTTAIRKAKSDDYLNLIPKAYSNPAKF